MKERIIDAAVECFRKYGPQRTSMADIAEAAGVSRKTLYRHFEDRTTLIERILIRQMLMFVARIEQHVATYTDFRESLVSGSIVAIETARADALFIETIQRATNHRLDQLFFGRHEEIVKSTHRIWDSAIAMGRKQGIVKQGLADERIIELIINIQALLLMREDYGPAEQRAFLEDVLVPAIIQDS